MIPHVGQQFGNYQLLRLLGKGGFAEVYLAQHFYIHTQAAVKILTGQMTPQEIQKFTTEAQIIASLSHPHILRVLDFGVHESIPFLVIEYAPHGTLRDRHRRGSVLPLATVLFYVKQIASALSYAHAQQLVHRDVKPENMLIDRHNNVVLSDFGIAIAAHKTASLSTQEAVGTVTYMAPEQIKGKARLASDQYSLAVVIYEWLCGTPPFDGSTSIEIAMAHLTDPPPLFQTKNATVPPMVEQVILKALEKDPQQRYASVEAFALALEQASETLPVQPPPTIPTDTFSSTYVLDFQNPTVLQPPPQKSMPTQKVETQQQSPLPGTTGSIPPNNETQQLLAPQHHISRRFVVLGLVGLTGMGIVGSSLAWLVRPTTSTANSLAATTSNTPTTTNLTPAPTTSKIPTPTTSKTPTPTTTPTSTSTTAPTPTSTTAPTPTPTTAPTPTPTTATTSLGTTLYTYTNHNAGMRALAWSPNGKRVATASDDYTAQVWDAMTGRNAIVYRGHSSYVEGVAWSPDGTYVVSGSADGTAQIWNSATGSPIYTYRGHLATYPWVNRVGWSPDGTYIVSCDQTSTVGRTATVQVWRATTGKTIVTYTGHTNGVYAVAWSPNGNFIASAGYDGTLQIWQATTGNPIATYRGNAYLFGLSWSPDNNAVAVGNSNNAVIVVNATSGNVLGTYNGHSAWVKDVAWSSDGKYIASGSDDGMVLLWNTTTGSNSYSYNGHSGHVNAVGWAANNSFIASGGDTVQVWQAE